MAAALAVSACIAPLRLRAGGPDAAHHVARDIKLGGDGRWDYVVADTAGHRLFIARQTRIMVVDRSSGRVLGEIPGLNGAHGVALVYSSGHGFATCLEKSTTAA